MRLISVPMCERRATDDTSLSLLLVGSGRFVAKTVGAGRQHRTKNASQASDLAVGLGVPTACLPDGEPRRVFPPCGK